MAAAIRPEATLLLLAAVLFALVVAVVQSDLADSVDGAIIAALRPYRVDLLSDVAHALSLLGSEAIGVLHLMLLVYLAWRRQWRLALGLFVATAGAGLLNGFLKDLFQRERPEQVFGLLPVTQGQLYSFPSGHAMVTAAFLTYLTRARWPAWCCPENRTWIGVVAVLVVVVGLARVFVGAHFLSDIIGGYVVGFIWANLVVMAGNLVRAIRRNSSRPTGESAVGIHAS